MLKTIPPFWKLVIQFVYKMSGCNMLLDPKVILLGYVKERTGLSDAESVLSSLIATMLAIASKWEKRDRPLEGEWFPCVRNGSSV